MVQSTLKMTAEDCVSDTPPHMITNPWRPVGHYETLKPALDQVASLRSNGVETSMVMTDCITVVARSKC